MKIPNIDSTVEVKTRSLKTFFKVEGKYEYFTLTGRVVKNEKWVDANSFTVYTGNPKFPKSIISLNAVVDIKLLSGSSVDIRQFKVKGSKTYTVSLSGNHYSCECVGFKYHAKCRHIEAVKNTLKNQ